MDYRLKKSIYVYNRALLKNYSKTYRFPLLFMSFNLKKKITNLYGFLRVVDEIIDTPSIKNKKQTLEVLKHEIINIKSQTEITKPNLFILKQLMKDNQVDPKYILDFLEGMSMDIDIKTFSFKELKKYTGLTGGQIGVIGLKLASNLNDDVFEKGKELIYDIASNFQLLNLIRDYESDFFILERNYLSDLQKYDLTFKESFEEIELSLKNSLKNLELLPLNCRFSIRISIYANLLILRRLKARVKNYMFEVNRI